MDWLEISVSVSGEVAEAVAGVLSRFAPNAVVTEQGIQYVDGEDLGTPEGPIVVRAYLPSAQDTQQTREDIEKALYYLGMIQPIPSPTYRELGEANWMEAWKEHYHPMTIGSRLLILPAWLPSSHPDRVSVRIDPGMAFGTGTHPSTQLCLEFIDEILAGPGPLPATFIDVGCGSGILSIAALKLGVRSALAVDIDQVALQNARENARANGLGTELRLGHGSIEEIRNGRLGPPTAELVVANILAPAIRKLLEDGLADIVAPRGKLILAGVLADQEDDIVAACHLAGLRVLARKQQADWIALCAAKQSIDEGCA